MLSLGGYILSAKSKEKPKMTTFLWVALIGRNIKERNITTFFLFNEISILALKGINNLKWISTYRVACQIYNRIIESFVWSKFHDISINFSLKFDVFIVVSLKSYLRVSYSETLSKILSKLNTFKTRKRTISSTLFIR